MKVENFILSRLRIQKNLNVDKFNKICNLVNEDNIVKLRYWNFLHLISLF